MTILNFALSHDKRPFCGPDVLAYYDGPQLFWLPCDGQRMLAARLPDEAGPGPFLVVALTEDQALAVLGNRITLRSVFLAASVMWVIRDYDADALVLEPIDVVPEYWLPGDVLLRMEGCTS